jgi:hypothetical protein
MSFDSDRAAALGQTATPASPVPAPGKRTLTQAIPATHVGPAPVPAPSSAVRETTGTAARLADDPFGLHLTKPSARPVISQIMFTATGAYANLVGNADRTKVIEGAAPVIGSELDSLHLLLAQNGASEPPEALRPLIEQATTPILKIRRWLDGRQGTATVIALFRRDVIDRLDAIRALLGLPATGAMDSPALPQQETEEEGRELRDMQALASAFHMKLIGVLGSIKEGTERFEAFAALKRPPPPTPWWASLAKATLIAVIGNLAGPLGGLIGKKIAGELGAKGAKEIGNWMAGVVTDAVEGFASDIASGALSAAETGNETTRDRRFFVEGFLATQHHLTEAAWLAIDERVKEKTISGDVLESIIRGMNDVKFVDLANLIYGEAARGFALLTAREGLGIRDDAGHRGETDMREYEGHDEVQDLGPVRFPMRVRDKRGTSGVGRLSAAVIDDGDGASIAIDRFQINGMNDDMAIAVMGRAGHQLAKLGIPLEIHVALPSVPLWSATLLIDEHGALQDALDWDVMNDDSSTRSANSAFYSTPARLWDAMKNIPLSEKTARLEKGG